MYHILFFTDSFYPNNKKPYFGCAPRKIIGTNYIENQAKDVNLFEIYRRK